MLPSSPQVQAVYLGASGVLEALNSPTPSSPVSEKHDREPKIFIDSTTLDVHIAREVASQVLAVGAEMVDAPVSGGVVGAKAGTLSFMVGGPETSFNRAKPLLEHMGVRIIHCGDAGNGLIAKLCNNHILVRVNNRNMEVGAGWPEINRPKFAGNQPNCDSGRDASRHIAGSCP